MDNGNNIEHGNGKSADEQTGTDRRARHRVGTNLCCTINETSSLAISKRRYESDPRVVISTNLVVEVGLTIALQE